MRLTLALLIPGFAVFSAGCDMLDAATSERPSATQMEALGDIFGAMGAFAAVINDPAAADTGDLADMHATEPYRTLLDPEMSQARVAPRVQRPLDAGCITVTGSSATWACPFPVGTLSCTATGNGTRNADGTVSGESTQTCEGVATTVKVIATNVVFDEAAGRGSGVLRVEVGMPSLSGWAVTTVDNLGFCTDRADPLPDQGRVTVDGLGILDALPFDPLTVRFTDSPVCGTALIE